MSVLFASHKSANPVHQTETANSLAPYGADSLDSRYNRAASREEAMAVFRKGV
jgi:hypothetical protein